MEDFRKGESCSEISAKKVKNHIALNENQIAFFLGILRERILIRPVVGSHNLCSIFAQIGKYIWEPLCFHILCLRGGNNRAFMASKLNSWKPKCVWDKSVRCIVMNLWRWSVITWRVSGRERTSGHGAPSARVSWPLRARDWPLRSQPHWRALAGALTNSSQLPGKPRARTTSN